MDDLVGAQGTTFSFTEGGRTRTLSLRLNPTEVNWSYNLITHVEDTYEGRVVQLLSINIDSLTIEGQLGVEGAYGKKLASGGRLVDRNEHEHFEFTGKYTGLHGMVEFFRIYFAVMSQGNDESSGQYRQIPMILSYNIDDGDLPTASRHWPQIIPMGFPSFRRSWDNFAPMWQVKAYVVEADRTIQNTQRQAALRRLQDGIGFRPGNPFIDPAADPATHGDLIDRAQNLVKGWQKLLPTYSTAALQELIWNDVSRPNFKDALPSNAEKFKGEISG